MLYDREPIKSTSMVAFASEEGTNQLGDIMRSAIEEAIIAFVLSLRSTHKLGFVHCSLWSGPPLQSIINKPLPLSNPSIHHPQKRKRKRKKKQRRKAPWSILLTYNRVEGDAEFRWRESKFVCDRLKTEKLNEFSWPC